MKPEAYIVDIVKNAMLTAWNEICSDTECHPLDIEHGITKGRSKHLSFEPRHWSLMVGEIVQVQIEKLFGWEPAETAPKDGTHILVCLGPFGQHVGFNHKPPQVVHYFDDPEAPGFYLSSGIVADSYNDNPVGFTHWKPLGKEPL